jgi:hypothetical protein
MGRIVRTGRPGFSTCVAEKRALLARCNKPQYRSRKCFCEVTQRVTAAREDAIAGHRVSDIFTRAMFMCVTDGIRRAMGVHCYDPMRIVRFVERHAS